MWVESRAIVRLALRGLYSVRGAFTALAGVVLMAGVPYAASLSVTRAGNFAATIHFMRDWAPEGFFLMVALGAHAPRGLFYRPAELALLFPAPIERRQLVLYNIVWRARISVLSALWLTYLGVLGGRPLPVALLGYTLILLLLQISSQWFAVLRASVSREQTTVALAGLGIVCAAIAWLRGGALEALSVIAWLTRPALEAVSADTLAHAAPWAVITMLTIAALVAGTCLMDSDYHATALARSLERKKRRRVRGGAGAYGPSVRSAWLRVPAFPYLQGAGPIAWRQCVELARNPRRIVLVLAVVAVSALGAAVVVQLEAGNDFVVMSHEMRAWTVIAVLTVTPLLSGDSLGFDFRRDLDRMATLKALPVTAMALSAGQVAPAAVFVTVVQALGMAAVAAMTDSISFGDVMMAVAVVVPMNWTAIAVENALFLIAPYRTVNDDPGDMTFAGRLALATALKAGSLLTLGALGAVVALVAMVMTKGSLMVTVSALVCTLILACIPATKLTGWAFERFDVGRDVPA
jgi:hypothetical protein